jgi:hypothetical protein
LLSRSVACAKRRCLFVDADSSSNAPKAPKPEALKSVAVIVESLKQMDHDSGIQGFKGSVEQWAQGTTSSFVLDGWWEAELSIGSFSR